MQFDIYRRPEPEHKLSFMAVPTGLPIPQEAINVDWALEARAVEMDETAGSFAEYAIEGPAAQIREKGYAITRVTHQVAAGD